MNHNSRRFDLFLFVLSVVFFVLSISVHILGLLGRMGDSDLWSVVVISFSILLGAVVSLKQRFDPSLGFAGIPIRLKIMMSAVAVYSFWIAAYVLFYMNKGGIPAFLNGEYVIHNHGKIIANLDGESFKLHRSYLDSAFAVIGVAAGFWGSTMFYLSLRRGASNGSREGVKRTE